MNGRQPRSSGNDVSAKPDVISKRKTCDVNGTGLTHYIFVGRESPSAEASDPTKESRMDTDAGCDAGASRGHVANNR